MAAAGTGGRKHRKANRLGVLRGTERAYLGAQEERGQNETEEGKLVDNKDETL